MIFDGLNKELCVGIHLVVIRIVHLGRLRWAGLTANLLPLGSFPTALLFKISTPVAWFFSM